MAYSEEQLNYFRLCHVGFDLVPKGVRKIFKKEWDFRYKTTLSGEWEDTTQNGLDFYSKESKASRKKNARCLATIQRGDTAKWDCTCLFFALLYSDCIGKTLAPTVCKDVDDIRHVRNEIAHVTEAKLAHADFHSLVDRVMKAFASLGLAVTEIQDVKNQTTFPIEEVQKIKKQARDLQAELDQTRSELQATRSTLQSTEAGMVSLKEENEALTEEISAKLQSFCFLTWTPPHDVIKRSRDIERITKKMEELYNGARRAVSTVYLSGFPGCGKTELGRGIGEFVSGRIFDSEDLTFVATLNAETIETLADSYMRLGRHLMIPNYSLSRLKEEKPIEAIRQLHHLILPTFSKFTKWLIIADNVIDLRLVRGLLPQTGSKDWGHGQVLITTQDSTIIPSNAPHTYHESLSGGMNLDEAVELLEKVSQILDREQAKKVAIVLDCQPLALAAAAYYVQTVVSSGSSSYDWKAYLQEFSTYCQRKVAANVLANENPAYPKTTMDAVEMAIQRAVDAGEVLRQTFIFLALCTHDDLPLETVSKFVKAQVKDQPESLIKAEIVRSSLIFVHSEEGDKRTYLRLHKVLHDALKQEEILNLLSVEADHNTAEAVKVFQSQLEENFQNYPVLKILRPHCESLLKHMTSDFQSDQSTFLKRFTPFIDLDVVIDWTVTFADVCHKSSFFVLGKKVVDLANNLLENMDDTHSGALFKTLNMSGIVYFHIGQYKKAEEFLEKALMISKKIFGEDHAKVATTYNNLALVYHSLGEYNQAKDLHERALMITKTIFGEDHANVATTYNNLASVYHSLGEYSQAKELHEKALMITKKILGEDHPNVATTYNNLALVYYRLGKYNQAKELYEKALEITKKNFGEDHANLATTYNNLASVYDRLGEYNQAKELHKKALMIRKKIFGGDHANVVTT